eukprot:SAG31_NODE_9470_length_1272_cov_1.606138_1_plen_150_part_00
MLLERVPARHTGRSAGTRQLALRRCRLRNAPKGIVLPTKRAVWLSRVRARYCLLHNSCTDLLSAWWVLPSGNGVQRCRQWNCALHALAKQQCCGWPLASYPRTHAETHLHRWAVLAKRLLIVVKHLICSLDLFAVAAVVCTLVFTNAGL